MDSQVIQFFAIWGALLFIILHPMRKTRGAMEAVSITWIAVGWLPTLLIMGFLTN